MRYVSARIKTEDRDTLYKVYMSDTLFQYAHNKMLGERFVDILNRKPQPKKTAQEIVDETLLKAGLTLKE